MPNEKIVFKITKDDKVALNTVSHELSEIQKDLKKFFGNKPIVDKFLPQQRSDYDD